MQDQISFNNSNSKKTEIVHHLLQLKSYNNFKKLFKGCSEAKIICFCASPEKIKETFDLLNLDKLEIIVGKDVDHRENLIGKTKLADKLEKLKEEGKLLIYTLKESTPVKIHNKCYILKKKDEDGFLVFNGSPNFSKNAWGRQHEAVTVFKTYKGEECYQQYIETWEDEKKYCELFLKDLTEELNNKSDEHVGSMELGSEFDKKFLQVLREDFYSHYFLYSLDSKEIDCIIAATTPRDDWQLSDEELAKVNSGFTVTRISTDKDHCWILALPFRDYSGKVQGYIKAVSVGRDCISLIANAKQNMYTLGIVSAILIAIIIFTFLTYSLKPIEELLRATKKIGAGDLNYRISFDSINSELNKLAQAFNQMVAKLQKSTNERKELLKEIQLKEKKRQELLNKLINAQEEERKRIARELHDETSQALTSLNLSLSTLKKVRKTEEFNDYIAMMKDIISELFNQLNQLAKQLRPDVLDDLGLSAAIKNYVKTSSQWWKQEIGLHIDGLEDTQLSKETEIAVYRIIQEALTNAFRHSNAANISVIIEVRNKELNIIIEDDGCGFNLNEAMSNKQNKKSLGLFGMQERAELLDGELIIETEKNIGTTIYVKIPIVDNF
ncbi:ATP-binding protein [Fuchsiella alkaliacetigena]|uniref:ATP-binding protein n=1 Tax=Fuchsiella alkaliacetigena TaxID=957042 RepID=UPI00200AE67B|nr:ATP-binding protein [Fuchsiella alkaliacetigena]MCK8826098.1 histidine kinase [Fuchsiella alkaliacetigena]